MQVHHYISPRQLKNMGNANCVILDVRTDMEHAGQHLDCPHHHAPLDRLDVAAFVKEKNIGKNQPIYILCRSGKRAEKAAEQFHAAGITDVHIIEGGIIGCGECGVALAAQSSAPMSLERQVRIVAGFLVVTGSLLAFFFNPAFLFLPLFVGCGLVFAGVTDKCGMALILAKAPWNKV